MILSRGPKFTLKNIIDKDLYLEGVEKNYIKEKYNMIGKVEKDEVIIEEKDEASEWLEKEMTISPKQGQLSSKAYWKSGEEMP